MIQFFIIAFIVIVLVVVCVESEIEMSFKDGENKQ